MFRFVFDRQNRYFMRLWLGQLISQFGDRLNQMALIGLIAEKSPGSALGLAKLLAFTIIPVFFIGPIAGVLVDRWDRRRTLFICDIARGLLVLTIPFLFIARDSMVPIYIVVFLTFCFSRFYVPAKMSIIPDLVAQEHLLVANTLMTTTGMIAFVLGAALGGILVDAVGARGGFIGDAITFFLSAVLIISINRKFLLKKIQFRGRELLSRGREIVGLQRSFMVEIGQGLRYLYTNRDIRFVIGILFILLAAAGAIYVVIIVFIQESFKSTTKDLGFLAVFLGIGLFLGALAYGRWGKKFLWYKTIFFCLIIGGVMTIIFALVIGHYPNRLMASLLSLILGCVVGPIFIASNTVVHFVSDENMRGKVFSALEVVIHFAFLVSMLISSFLCAYVERSLILISVGGLFTVIGLIGILGYKDGQLTELKH